MDIRGYEFFKVSGLPVSGVTVDVFDAVDGTPSTILSTTTTTSNGRWEFLSLTDTPKDVRVTFSGSIKWYKGLVKDTVTKFLVGAGGLTVTGTIGVGVASSASVGLLISEALTAVAGGAAAIQITTTTNLNAAANGDSLYGLVVNPVYTDAGHTGVNHYGIYAPVGLDYFGANVGIGTTPSTAYGLIVAGALTSGSFANQYGILSQYQAATTATGEVAGIASNPATAPGTTTNILTSFHAVVPTKGAGSTITNTYGMLIDQITGSGTNNVGLYITAAPTGAGTMNITAYMPGDVVLGNGGLATSATTGFVFLPAGGGGAPTGTPTHEGVGVVANHSAAYVDIANSKFCLRISGAWKCATLA